MLWGIKGLVTSMLEAKQFLAEQVAEVWELIYKDSQSNDFAEQETKMTIDHRHGL